MNLRNVFQKPAAMLRAGLVFLILANLSRYFLHASARISEGVVDGARGFLFGLAIGCLLLFVSKYMRRRAADGAGPCGQA